jgi:carbonic anhydrase/acetyltransferase-like protein (isoleucine patch superfamily)
MDYLKLDTVTPVTGPPPDLPALEARLADLRAQHPGVIFKRYLDKVPTVAPRCFLAEGAVLIGDVRIAEGASVWYGCVLRADLSHIAVGARSNLQDGTVVHLGDVTPTVIGEDVTVGHRAVLHGCTIEDACLIGMQSTILDGAVVGFGSTVGAGAVVTAGTVIPRLSLVFGTPGKVVKTLPEGSEVKQRLVAAKYLRLVHNHQVG